MSDSLAFLSLGVPGIVFSSQLTIMVVLKLKKKISGADSSDMLSG